MSNEKEKIEKEENDQKGEPLKSDPGTVHTTDPQEHMKGPLSSLMHEVGEGFEDKDAEDADEKPKE